jgi:hypothetical protein
MRNYLILKAARDFLFDRGEDYEGAVNGFPWSKPQHLNWVLEWFDQIGKSGRFDRARLYGFGRK